MSLSNTMREAAKGKRKQNMKTGHEHELDSPLPDSGMAFKVRRLGINAGDLYPDKDHQNAETVSSQNLKVENKYSDERFRTSQADVDQDVWPGSHLGRFSAINNAGVGDFRGSGSVPESHYGTSERFVYGIGNGAGQPGPSNWADSSDPTANHQTSAVQPVTRGSSRYLSRQPGSSGTTSHSSRASSMVNEAPSSVRTRPATYEFPKRVDFQLAPGLYVNPQLQNWVPGGQGGIANAGQPTAMGLRRRYGAELGNQANGHRQENELVDYDLYEVGTYTGEGMPVQEVVCRHNMWISQCSSERCRRQLVAGGAVGHH